MRIFIAIISVLLFSCKPEKPLETVSNVDEIRYMGIWYEIARLPNRFENGLTDITATYSLRNDGKITVHNKGLKTDGTLSEVKGIACIPDASEKAKLKVSFFRPFYGKYWIIALDTLNYQYAMVAHPNRDYLWILSRTPRMERALYDELIASAAKKGFDTTQMVRVTHR